MSVKTITVLSTWNPISELEPEFFVAPLQSGEKALGIETGKAHPGADEHHDEAMLQSEEFNLLLASYEKRLTLLEAVYRHLLSDDFCYHIGQLGPDM